MPVNVGNLEKLLFFTPNGHPRVCWDIFIIIQLDFDAIENARIDNIDKIDKIYRINCIDQYKYNQSNRSDLLTLQTSPKQLHHCCFLFLFA